MASTNRSTGRFTTPCTATAMSVPITSTETAVSHSAAVRVLASRSSKRLSEKRAATAPATPPSSWMGAITSHERPSAPERSRETTMPPRMASSSWPVKGRRCPGSLVATTASPVGRNRTMSSCSTLRRAAMIWWILRSISAPASSSCASPMVAAISRANTTARVWRSSSRQRRESQSSAAANVNDTTTTMSRLSSTSLARTPRRIPASMYHSRRAAQSEAKCPTRSNSPHATATPGPRARPTP